MRWAPLVVAGLAVMASGCVNGLDFGLGACPAPGLATLTGPLTADGHVSRSPGQGAPALIRLNNTAQFEADLVPMAVAGDDGPAPVATPFNQTSAAAAPGGAVFATALVPPADGGDPSARNVSFGGTLWDADECHTLGTVEEEFVLAPPVRGEAILPGNGAIVHTAGFWRDNGTLFYTNMDRVHEDLSWPRAGWYEYESGDPLPVYIYNQTSDEMPNRYRDAGWFTTIEGFNGALRAEGRSAPYQTTGGILADIPPERAYTKPQYAGNQTSPAHDLYGDALVFYIEVVDVVQEPCPLLMGPLCEVPEPPPAVT